MVDGSTIAPSVELLVQLGSCYMRMWLCRQEAWIAFCCGGGVKVQFVFGV